MQRPMDGATRNAKRNTERDGGDWRPAFAEFQGRVRRVEQWGD